MPTNISTNTLQREALRLLKQQIDLIEDMTAVENLIVAEKDDREKQSFSPESARDDIEVLGDEIKKLEKLVLVVAVVGTMKAGKSTVINAIAGTEVLPARNRAMTAVPTLIKHKASADAPVLRFENHRPVNDLVGRLRDALKEGTSEGLTSKISSDPHFKDLVNFVKDGGTFKTQYEGAAEVAEFLKDLNDLVRFSRELNIDFPFDSYDSVEEMPVIEVEFAHIEGTSGDGELCLLDTPGPNESGQPHLHKILREQLAKASAVVAVLDYTQMGSHADAEVRGEIDKIATAMGDRAYALVNKFDEFDRHGDDEAQLKYQVSEDMLRGLVSDDRVFPVSAKRAYLSNRTKNELRKTGCLPDPAVAPWLEDFGNEALGMRWKKEIGDVKEVRDAANELWEKSLFGGFLQHVIRAAHEDKAALAIDSAFGKLRVYGERISNCLSVRGNSLKIDADEAISDLETQIQDLKADDTRIKDSETNALQLAEKLFKGVKKDLDQACSENKGNLQIAIRKFFSEGRKIEKLEFEKRKEEKEKSRQPKTALGKVARKFSISFLPPGGETKKDMLLFKPGESIEIESEDEAKRLLKDMSDEVEKIKTSFEGNMREQLADIIKHHVPEIERILNDSTREVAAAVNERLGMDFGVHIQPPKTRNLKMKELALESFDDAVREVNYEVERYRRQSGIWGTICKWFETDDWGWEMYMAEETRHVIDIKKIRRTVEGHSRQFTDAAMKYVVRDIESPLKEAIKRNCQELTDRVRRLRGDFEQGIKDRSKTKKEQKALITEIDRIIRKYKKVGDHIEGLGEAITAVSHREMNQRNDGGGHG